MTAGTAVGLAAVVIAGMATVVIANMAVGVAVFKLPGNDAGGHARRLRHSKPNEYFSLYFSLCFLGVEGFRIEKLKRSLHLGGYTRVDTLESITHLFAITLSFDHLFGKGKSFETSCFSYFKVGL